MSAPNRPSVDWAPSPYAVLIAAIVHRAWRDATGHCDSPGHSTPAQLQAEAQAWLEDEQAVAGLLELAGYDAAPGAASAAAAARDGPLDAYNQGEPCAPHKERLMQRVGNAIFMGKPSTFWVGGDGAVYTGPVGETYWLQRSWPSTETFRHWAEGTRNAALLTALDGLTETTGH